MKNLEQEYHFNTIAKTIRFISQEYQSQPTLDEVAAHVHLSKFHLQRLFKKWAGVSPKEFLQFITIEQAKKALEKGQTTFATAFEVGLSGTGRLHDLFVKLEACTPGEFKQKGNGIAIQWAIIETPFGKAMVAETSRGICKLNFIDADEALESTEAMILQDFPDANLHQHLGQHGQLLETYFNNWQVPSKRIGLDLKGTPFQVQVWKALLQIPAGHLVAYQDIATAIDKPKAVRAVGTAIGKNPIAYLIPCHRVIKSNGVMGNYRWNSERKLAINGYEGIHFNYSNQ